MQSQKSFGCYNQIQLMSYQQHKLESFTTSKTDHHLSHQKVHQRISVMKKKPLVFLLSSRQNMN